MDLKRVRREDGPNKARHPTFGAAAGSMVCVFIESVCLRGRALAPRLVR